MKNLTEKDIDLLRKAEARILVEPGQFIMHNWFHDKLFTTNENGERVALTKAIPNCGTAACIKGHLLCIEHDMNPAECHRKFCDITITENTDLSGLKDVRLDYLFYMSYWPEQFQTIHEEGTLAFAEQAVARIEHFIKTDGKE